MTTEIQARSPATLPLTAPPNSSLAAVPPDAQWFANLTSVQTRRAYQNDIDAFMRFTGIVQPEEFRSITRSHVQSCAGVARLSDARAANCANIRPVVHGGGSSACFRKSQDPYKE